MVDGGGGDALIFAFFFQHLFESLQASVPDGADFLQPVLDVVERFGGERVAHFAAFLMDAYESGVLQDGEMFADALAGNGVVAGQLGGRARAVLGEI